MHFSGAIQNISVSLKDANKVRKRGTGKGERRTEKRKPKTRKMERESRTESTAVIRLKIQMADDDTEKVSSTQVLFELSRPRNYHER